MIAQAHMLPVIAYKDTRNCTPDENATYRIFEGSFDSLDVCQGIAGAPTNPTITCTEYTNGGKQGPTPCADVGEDNFRRSSIRLTDTTTSGVISTHNVFCGFYVSGDCNNPEATAQLECIDAALEPQELGIVSFRCVR